MAKSKARRGGTSQVCLLCIATKLVKTITKEPSERLSALIRRNHVSIWNWIQRYKPKRIFQSRRSISGFIIDETLIKEAGSDYVLRWIAIEPKV
jgi:hypothetical protein